MSDSTDELVYFNGVNASTGDYLIPPLPAEQIAELARGASFAPEQLAELKWRKQEAKPDMGTAQGVDPLDLAQAGWGVIFAQNADPAIRDALAELLDYRKEQANRTQELYREYSGDQGYRPNESKNVFLARQGAGPGPVNPARVPYYLLLVGDPEKIPYSFQSQLDVAYAVGRIHFDTPDEYSQYAQNVVRAERAPQGVTKRAAFFGVSNPDDNSTRVSAERLVNPLAEKIKGANADWGIDTFVAEQATKGRLEQVLGADAPALLFTASHGVAFDVGDSRQLKQQGALLCQDWAGPQAGRGQAITQAMYYAADDLASDRAPTGMISFHFACFGAGTPRFDEYSHLRQGVREQVQIAPVSFMAKLPRRLLAHPKGGALAVIGHVDRAWGSSFLWNSSVEQLDAFSSTLQRLLEGNPVGYAMEFFNLRYAELATALSAELENQKFGKKTDATELAMVWTANNDARGYAVIGDPAVRLQLRPAVVAGQARPTIELARAPNGSNADAAQATPPPVGASDATPELAQTLAEVQAQLTEWLKAASDAKPIEISTAVGDARLVSQLSAGGEISTTVQGIAGENLVNVHTRLVRAAHVQRIESLRELLRAVKDAIEAQARTDS